MKKLIYLLFFSVLGTEIGFFLSDMRVTQLANNSAIFFLFCIFFIIFTKIKRTDFYFLLIFSTIILLNFFIKESLLEETNSRDLFYLFILVVALTVVKNIELSKNDFNILKVGIYLASFLYYSGSSNPSNYGFYPLNYLMYGYSNPNVFSSVLLTNVIFLGVFISKNKIIYCMDFILIIINIYLINKTGARTALAVAIMMLAFTFFRYKIPKRINNLTGYLSIYFPILFIPLKGLSSSFMSLLNKFSPTLKVQNLNGRDYIWSEQFKLLLSNFRFFLIGAQPPNESLMYHNSHNYLVSIFFKHGVILFFMYMYSISTTVINKLKFDMNVWNTSSLFGWFLIIVSNSSESYLSSGLVSISILWVLLLSDITELDENKSKRIGLYVK